MRCSSARRWGGGCRIIWRHKHVCLGPTSQLACTHNPDERNEAPPLAEVVWENEQGSGIGGLCSKPCGSGPESNSGGPSSAPRMRHCSTCHKQLPQLHLEEIKANNVLPWHACVFSCAAPQACVEKLGAGKHASSQTAQRPGNETRKQGSGGILHPSRCRSTSLRPLPCKAKVFRNPPPGVASGPCVAGDGVEAWPAAALPTSFCLRRISSAAQHSDSGSAKLK
jgi:hypothetical protein